MQYSLFIREIYKNKNYQCSFHINSQVSLKHYVIVKKSFFHFILKESKDKFNHANSILPLIFASLFASAFKPTFNEFDFRI